MHCDEIVISDAIIRTVSLEMTLLGSLSQEISNCRMVEEGLDFDSFEFIMTKIHYYFILVRGK